ncbi:MAG: ABC transporter ATP-binding protein [Bacteroidetes bacterium 4484_276]|nr:MAG: ABC transporter ATP-binding protein [Bacteroidetes bacterium 4484_276]
MNNILNINSLTKTYGRITAVNNLDLDINQGDVYGLLGPNGSGKTTTFGILLDIVKPDSGSFSWFGEAPSHNSRKRIGATLEHPIFYPYLSAVKNLRIVARIKEKPFDDFDDILKMVDLYERKDYKFRTYSMGMKQRLAIASALIGKPEVLILDEPTNGLDPQGIAEIRNLVIRIANEGVTILVASHLLDEVQKMCNQVAVLKQGKKLFSGPVGEVFSVSDTVEMASENLEILLVAISGFKGISSIRKEGELIVAHVKEGINPGDISEFLVEKGIVLSHLALRKKSLEQQFLELLQEAK